MNIVTMGSCLSQMVAKELAKNFGMKLLNTVAHNRSDQFYHYYIKKDLSLVPLEYYKPLVSSEVLSQDQKTTTAENMLENQYPDKIGLHRLSTSETLFETLENNTVDIIIMDDFLEVGAILAYPKEEKYQNAPIFLRKQDYVNFDTYFDFGKKIDLRKSTDYINKILAYFKEKQPDAKIFFIHYPYNTYDANSSRAMRSKSYAEVFNTKMATVIPAWEIEKKYQIEGDPAHFHQDIYQKYAAYIHDNLRSGLLFFDHHSFATFSTIPFQKDSIWKLEIHFHEYENTKDFNFFFGERGSRYFGLGRFKNRIVYRLGDGTYIKGIRYNAGESIRLTVTYNAGEWTFSDGVNHVTVVSKTDVLFNAIGSGFNGLEHEQKTNISFVKISYKLDKKSLFQTKALWRLNENKGCIAFDSSSNTSLYPAILENIEWIHNDSSKVIPNKYPLETQNPLEYMHKKPIQKIDFLHLAYKKPSDIFVFSLFQNGLNEYAAERGKLFLEDIYTFKHFEAIKLSEVLTWKENPFDNRTWQWQLHQIIFYIDILAGYENTNDLKYINKLTTIITSWYEKNYLAEPPSEMSWHDHSTTLRLRSFIYTWEYFKTKKISLDETFLNILLNLIQTHCDILATEDFYMKHSNHGYDQSFFLYLASVSFPEFENAQQWHDIAFYRLLDECAIAFTSEGIHVENSPSYLVEMLHRISLLSRMFKKYEFSTKIDLDMIINNALKVLAYYILPNGTLPMLGDTDLTTKVPAFTHLKKYASYALFEYVHSRGTKREMPKALPSHVFKESGYAIFRNHWDNFDTMIHMVFKCSFLNTFHRHDDDLNILLYAFNEEWFVDGGIYKYSEKDPYRQYLRSALAHNIPVIPDVKVSRVIPPPDKRSAIIEHRIDDNHTSLKAQTFMHENHKVVREIAYDNDRTFTISDSVSTLLEKPIPYDVMFHIPIDKTIEIIDDNTIHIKSKQGHVLHMTFTGECTYAFEIVTAQEKPNILGWQAKTFGKLEAISALICHVSPNENNYEGSSVTLSFQEKFKIN